MYLRSIVLTNPFSLSEQEQTKLKSTLSSHHLILNTLFKERKRGKMDPPSEIDFDFDSIAIASIKSK